MTIFMTRQLFLICLIGLLFASCLGDGVDLSDEFTNSDNIVKAPDSLADNLRQAQYHFELGLKMAILDHDIIGNWDGAILELDTAIDLNPNFVNAYHYRAVIHSYLQHYDQAMADINKALTLDDKHILSYFFRAGLFANKLEVDKAIDDFNKIIRLEPNNGKAYDHRGYAKIQMGDKSGGCDDFKKARELGFMVGNKEGDKFICK